MGLFIGASILTILELFDYIYEVSALPSPYSWQGLGLKALMPAQITTLHAQRAQLML